MTWISWGSTRNRVWAYNESLWHYGKGKGVGVQWEGLVILNWPLCNLGILGGLLSGHQHAVKVLPKYKGGLLNKARKGVEKGKVWRRLRTWQAVDLGERLLRAFDTPTGMPRCRVNLRSGIPKALRDHSMTMSSKLHPMLLISIYFNGFI